MTDPARSTARTADPGWSLPDELALVCSACGAVSTDPLRFACPAARPGDDVDHRLEPPEPPLGHWPAEPLPDPADAPVDSFVRYRTLLYPHRLHRAWGGDDATFLELVRRLQRAVAGVDGVGFAVTPLRRAAGPELVGPAARPGAGAVWMKDETGNVSGSHKGRHLFGLALHLAVVARHRPPEPGSRPRLAISSCGNAALAAAVVAAAAGFALEVFVPPDAAPSVLARLDALGAAVTTCERRPGERGDPCFLRFLEALAQGALPFATQGTQNGLTIDGAATLGYELAEQLSAAGAGTPRRLYVQVGGGALAAAVCLGLRRAVLAGRLGGEPALFAVQTAAAAPLARAHQAVLARSAAPRRDADAVIAELAQHRSAAMWPWEQPPRSIATGILDDETYDWRPVLSAVVRTGGAVLVVSEAELAEANERGRAVTGIDADATGTAGLAGLLHHHRPRPASGAGPAGDAVVLFTGRRR